MCHYITATLPQNVKPELIAPIFESHKFGFKLVSNPHVAAQTTPADLYVLTTRGNCDCGTVLGSSSRDDRAEGVSYEKELKKFRQQGWSETKIQRWIEQKEQVKDRHRREDEAGGKASEPLAAPWIRLITELLTFGYTRRVGLLLHWYSRGIESERIKIVNKERVRLAELTAEVLVSMKEDVLYEFMV
jgi:hypothetical protein